MIRTQAEGRPHPSHTMRHNFRPGTPRRIREYETLPRRLGYPARAWLPNAHRRAIAEPGPDVQNAWLVGDAPRCRRSTLKRPAPKVANCRKLPGARHSGAMSEGAADWKRCTDARAGDRREAPYARADSVKGVERAGAIAPVAP